MSDLEARSWALPGVDGPVVGSRSRSSSASELSTGLLAARQRNFDDARQRGFDQGVQEASALRAELSSTAEQLRQLLDQAARPLAALDDELINELCLLALSIGKQLARRELRIDPTQVAAIVRETIALLPANCREVRVLLHPVDAGVLRDNLAPAAAERAWQLLEDSVMTRGGCRVESEHARIDARFESRVAAIADELLQAVPGGK
jgi:flagellar assembly protein FliH